MLKSDTIGELAKALVNVQKVLEGAKKDSKNPFFKSSYADLSSVWEACRKPLAENGLAVIQTMDLQEGADLIIETMLVHTSGEWISGQLWMKPVKDDPQGIGSAITYARRYALAAIVGVCPEDDDAEQAMSRTAPKPALAPPAPSQRIEEASRKGVLIERLKPALRKKGVVTPSQLASYLKAHGFEHMGFETLTDEEAIKLSDILISDEGNTPLFE